MRGGRGGRAAVAAAAALLAFVFAAPPLLSSSATSAALQTSVREACPADVGLVLNVEDAWLPQLATAARSIDHTLTPIVSNVGSTRIETDDGSERATVLARDGAEDHLPGGPVAAPAGSTLLPASYASASRLRAGDELVLVGGSSPTELAVGAVYPDIPVQPEPAYWCGVRELVRTTGPTGAPTPVLLADEATVAAATPAPTTLWELDPDPSGLTLHRAETLQRELEQLAAGVGEPSNATSDSILVPNRIAPDLQPIIAESRQHGDQVTGSMIGPRLIAFAIAIALLLAATWLVVRQRRDELTVRAVRGESPAGMGLRVAERAAFSAVSGVVLGTVVSFVVVRALGPSPDVDTSAVRRALLLAAISLVLTMVVVGVTGAWRADALVDRQPRPRRRSWPWELLPIALALVGLARLDRIGGLQIAGQPPLPSDALAQSFPAFAVVAIAAVVIRPLSWWYRRARHGGRSRGAASLLGWRRLGADAPVHALVTGAALLAVGVSVIAGSVIRTVDDTAAAKSATFLGSDLRVVTSDEPVIPASITGTPVSRAAAESGGIAVTIIGIDPDTFASAVHWHDDASAYPLTELLQVLQVDDMEGAPLPAVLVGGRLTAPVFTTDGEPVGVDLNIIATAETFPGKAGEPLIVVNRDALAADEVPTAQEIWVKDPPSGAVDALAAAGNTIRGSQTIDEVFDPAGADALRWSFAVLWALAAIAVLGVLVAAAILLGWRRPERRPGWALRPRIGEPRREEGWATCIALAVAAVLGAVIGVVAGWLLARLVVSRLDTVDSMTPTTSFALDLLPAAVVVAALAVVVIVSALAATSGVLGVDPVEVTRDGVGR